MSMSKEKFLPKDLSSFSHLLGLIGFPLSHSFSKRYFAEKFQKAGIDHIFYDLFPLEEISQLPGLIQKYPNLKGLNVTIPYKEQVLPYLDEIDPAAKAIGAVNTIIIKEGRLIGYNTDYYGFYTSLHRLLERHQQEASGALILGTGGASKAIAHALEKSNIPYLFISRKVGKGNLTYAELSKEHLADYPLIINTTPLGMSPNDDSCPAIPYEFLRSKNTLYDLVYNPEKTLFLIKGNQLGCPTINGLEMLHLQAEEAWRIWQEILDF